MGSFLEAVGLLALVSLAIFYVMRKLIEWYTPND